MGFIPNKRSVMTLYSDPQDIHCHRVRMVLAEKGVSVEIIDIDYTEQFEQLHQLNPYNTVPTLVDRDLVVYNRNIVMEYLDERFPHPPLMPVYPVGRAETRIMIHRLERDLYPLLAKLQESIEPMLCVTERQQLIDGLVSLSPVFAGHAFFLNNEVTLLDCCIAPLLWRLPSVGIELPAAQTKDLQEYMNRIFSCDTFEASLSEVERELRDLV
jgi:RNA polymerase-associated protein